MRIPLVLFYSMLALQVAAHPGNGIVVLADGRVLTGDAVGNGTWLFEAGKPPRRQVRDFHCHWLTRGQDGQLYAESQGESNGQWTVTHYRLDRDGANPVRLGSGPLHRSNFTVDRHGHLVFAESGRLMTQDRAGGLLPWRGNGRVLAGDPPLGSVSAMAWGPRDILYLSEGPNVRKVGPDGIIRMVARFGGRPSVSMYAGQGNAQRVWGLAVDEAENVYVALASNDQVIKIEPGGKREVIDGGQRDGWIATGVATSGDRLYLLESKVEGNRNLGPRVRMRGRPSGWVVLGTVTQR